MEKQNSFKSPALEKQQSFHGVTENQSNPTGGSLEKQQSFRGVAERQSSIGKVMEKQKSFRGFMEKQKSFRVVMERQLSFIGVSERKKTKESPGKRGDLQLHLAARAGNLSRIREILQNCDGDDAKQLLSKQNIEGETPLYAAAENGHVLVVAEMLKYMDLEIGSIAARNGYDPLHVAARQGHREVLKELLATFPNLVMTTDLSCSTALHTAATQGHADVVNLLLETDSNLAKIAKNNGKTVLHSAARMGHLEVVRALLSKDPNTAFRTDKKGQTALHMAAKGQNEEIVLELLKSDSSVLTLEDNKGNTALHIATIKGRTQIVRCLLSVKCVNMNAINKAGESPLDVAEKFGNLELVHILREAGATNSKNLGKPPSTAKQLKQTVSDIKHDVQSQLQQTRQTGVRVQKIAKKLKKLHISGLNNAINSSTVVAVLIATVAFAAIFSVPGQYVEVETKGTSLGQAQIGNDPLFILFFVFDSLALFISLAVVVVQTSVVVIEERAKKQLVFVINKLMWLACLFISIAFISLTYVVVGKKYRWLAVSATAIGGTIMLTTIGAMFYCVILHQMEESKLRNIRRAESRSLSYSMPMEPDPEILNSEYKRMYAL
ncbi:Ank_2 domain-containing protein/PGG domain-containing protein [Cephalotus follicularis]|uniref:Ank_2 domain-containing protein/PGG domain-containing protein n=1 Tax=Cephalotus follicularis TaxID=3775 RepID=A0A1Q3BGK0_CEPFO|nr:Ank_2 domain-containing protein/PGG domain-containing protein [Cephalotus follicularis]